MRKYIFLFIIICICGVFAKAKYIKIPQLGSDAPSFKAESTQGTIIFPKNYKGKWVILFSLPSTFSPICSSELKTLLQEDEYFKKKNCEIVGISFADIDKEREWLNAVREKWSIKSNLLMIADNKTFISRKYGIYQPNISRVKAMRCVYFIDPLSKIRAVMVYPLFNGRNINEIKRLLNALQISDENDTVTPANWVKGGPTYKCPQCRGE